MYFSTGSKTIAHFSLALVLLLGWTCVDSQQSIEFDRHEVHYSTINTNMLSPEIASAYGIQRAGTQAMLNITVLDKRSGKPVEAQVGTTAVNLTGQRREIGLRQVEDQDAIYYIGQFRIHDEETLNFSIEVLPQDHAGPPLTFSFRQQFFTG